MDTPAPFAAAMWARMLVTWWGMLRESNTTVGSANLLDTGACICRCDVKIDEAQWRVLQNIWKSKTNQYPDRVHKVVLQGQRSHALDPVAALLNHLQLNNPQPGDALFTFVEADKPSQITHTMLVTVAKLLFACQGGDPASVSGHSYRRGMATTAFRAGVPDALLQQHGD